MEENDSHFSNYQPNSEQIHFVPEHGHHLNERLHDPVNHTHDSSSTDADSYNNTHQGVVDSNSIHRHQLEFPHRLSETSAYSEFGANSNVNSYTYVHGLNQEVKGRSSGLTFQQGQGQKSVPTAVLQAQAMRGYGGDKRSDSWSRNDKNTSNASPSYIDSEGSSKEHHGTQDLTEDSGTHSLSQNVRDKTQVSQTLKRRNTDIDGIQSQDNLKYKQCNKEFNEVAEKKQELNMVSRELLLLPPPPKQRKTYFMANNSYRFDHAKVPSSQAVFPKGFDARTEKPPVPKHSKVELQTKEESGSNDVASEFPPLSKFSLNSNSTASELPPLSKSSPNVSHVSVSHNAAVKFIPRQAVRKAVVSTKTSVKTPKEDVHGPRSDDLLNLEIRKNALILKDPQGPSDVIEKRETNRSTNAEQSVNKSVKEIRQKISKIKR